MAKLPEHEPEWREIQERAKLKPYKPPLQSVMKEIGERRRLGIPGKGREYLVVGRTDIGSYSIHTRRTKESCHIRVVENLPEERTHIVGVWSGDPAVCEPKKREVAGVIHQVRAEKHRISGVKLLPHREEAREVKPERYIVALGERPLTKKPVPIQTARDVARSVSTVQFEDINVRDSRGHVEETYRRGARTYTRKEHAPPPVGRQFYTPPPEKSMKTLREELLEAAERGDTKTMARIVKELAGE